MTIEQQGKRTLLCMVGVAVLVIVMKMFGF